MKQPYKKKRERGKKKKKAFLIKPLDPYANFQKILELKNICYLIHQGGNSQNPDWKTPGLKTKQKPTFSLIRNNCKNEKKMKAI